MNVDYSDASSILWLIPSGKRKPNRRKILNIMKLIELVRVGGFR